MSDHKDAALEDEKLIDELMAKRDATRKVTSLHDVWLAGYLRGQDPDGRMGDNPYPARVEPEKAAK
jgi:hypothetical protein